MKILDILKKITGYENLEVYDNRTYTNMWESWYTGKVKDFHNYKIYNGKKEVEMTRYSLGMAKRACEDWANLLINEKTDITLSDEKSQNELNNILANCHFWRKANEGVEKTFALGIGAWVLSVEKVSVGEDGSMAQDGNINVTFVNGKKVIPITIEDDLITECAFVNVSTNKTYISVHMIDQTTGNYKIYNVTAHGNDYNLTFDESEMTVFDTANNLPWFQILKPNIANNIDINSPLGISVFANSIDILKEIDLIFDSYANEFSLGKKRIFINAQSLYVDKDGKEKETFDSNDVAFYTLPESVDGSTLIQESTQTLRITEHQSGMQDMLNLFSYSCGFGTEHYKYNNGNVATATQVISENSEMFRNIKKHEILIEDALIGLVQAMIYAANAFTPFKLNAGSNIEIKFDDSIIEDKAAEKANDRLDVSMGVMSKAEFRAKWYNEDLATAQRKIAEMSNLTIQDDEEEPQFGDNNPIGV